MRDIMRADRSFPMHAPGRGGAGAALVIALAASAVVALSVALLLGYINRMTLEQARRERMAQARLSQASAGDMIGAMLASERVPFTNGDGFLELSGQTTRISYESKTGLPPVRIGLSSVAGLEGFRPVESSGSIVLAGVRGGRFEAWEFDGSTGEPLPRSPIVICEASGDWLAAGFGRGSGRLFAAASEGPSGVTVSLVGVDGSVVGVATDLPSLDGFARAEAGTAGGQPVLVLSGPAGARAFYFASGESVEMTSPPGTCPVMARGAIWTASTREDAAEGEAYIPVLDVLRGDWDADGSEDICWIAGDRVTVMLSSSGALLCDSCPGAGPGAWGDMGGTLGLAVRWNTPAGITAWRNLAAGRFSNMAGGGALALPWEGRLSCGRGFVAGSMEGKVELYTSAGRPLADLGGSLEAVLDLDGGSADFVLHGEEGWSVVLDPADGPGEAHTWRLTTAGEDGRQVLTGRVTFSVFGSASGGARLYREDAP